MSHFYILEINTLSVALFANIFSHSMGCLFILFMVSFAVQKLLNLVSPCMFIFAFVFVTLRGESKKDIAAIYVKECLSMVSFKNFIVSSITFSSLNHFEFTFVLKNICSNFSILYIAI